MTEYDAPPVAASFEERGTPEALAALYGALARAQGKFGVIKRAKTVAIRSDKGNYSFAYAPLEDLHAATRQALTDEGLSVLTPMGTAPAGKSCVRTILAHQDGGRIIGSFEFIPLNDIKLVGGQVTYLRRYGYSALLNLASDDDADDNDQPMPTRGARTQKPAAQAPVPEGPSPGELAAKERAAQALKDHEAGASHAFAFSAATGQVVARTNEDGDLVKVPATNGKVTQGEVAAAYVDLLRKADDLGIDTREFNVPGDASVEIIVDAGKRLRTAIGNVTAPA